MKYKLLSVVAVVLVIVAVALWGRTSLVSQRQAITPDSSVEDVLSGVFSHIDSTLDPVQGSSQLSFWRTSDSHLVAVKTKGSVTGHIKGLGKDSKTLSAVDSINTYANRTLESAGYKVDPVNSATSTDNSPFFVVRQAFVKSDGSSRCVITQPVSIYTWSIDCIDTQDLAAAYEAEKPFLNLFEDAKDIALIPMVQGNFALINATDGSAGYYAILKKQTDGWSIVYKGQQSPSCQLMKEEDVPESVYKKCI